MAKTFRTAFFAYPAVPADLRLSVELASEQASTRESKLNVTPWAAMDALGAHIADEVRKRIAGSSFLVAEITRKNFNVYYEIGYAIGKGIPLLPVVNRSFADASRSVRDDGFFDNILYETYENAEQLSATIASFVGTPLLQIYARDIEINQPLYVLDSYRKTDFRNAIISTVKGSKVFYRSFDPVETPRFSTTKIISEATASVGAIIPFLAEHIEDASRHNLRASFLAGIMHGLGRDVLLIQHGDNPVPADFREDIVSINSPNQVEDVVEQFSVEALKSIQSSARSHLSKSEDKSVLQRLSLGSSAAENEFRSLDRYFIETAEYVRAVKGDGKIVVGRKGSGKTAIFFMVRNHLRDNKNNIVADLKPESHELVKLREVLVSMASAGVLIHTFTGFWQIIILTELLLKVRESRSLQAKYSMEALNVITQIDSILERYKIPAKGDFTARLNSFVTRMIGEIEKFAQKEGEKISAEKLTNFVYGDEHRELRTELAKHCDDKGIVAVLFDNLDKGWPATGADPDDVTVIRSLIDALNKIQRELAHDDIDFRFSVFLRNDVYELLVETTSDRGKEAAIRIDWSDREKLSLLIGRRISASLDEKGGALSLWDKYFPTDVGERAGIDFAIDHSLMRPRFLIDIVERSVSFALNRDHGRVTEDDLRSAIRQHAYYLVDDFGYEIRDVSGITNKVIDAFLGSSELLTRGEILQKLEAYGLDKSDVERAFTLLKWYGFFGIAKSDRDRKFIYDYEYSIRRIEAEIQAAGDDALFVINPAFSVGLN